VENRYKNMEGGDCLKAKEAPNMIPKRFGGGNISLALEEGFGKMQQEGKRRQVSEGRKSKGSVEDSRLGEEKGNRARQMTSPVGACRKNEKLKPGR